MSDWLDAEHREQTLALLGDLGLSYVCVDEPQGFASSVPPVVAVTAPLAFARFHGRNAAMWEERTQTASERFDYYYRPEELDEWVPRIQQLASESDELHLVINTNNFEKTTFEISFQFELTTNRENHNSRVTWIHMGVLIFD